MQNLRVFFESHFNTDRLSDDAVRKFAEDHLQRMAGPGLYPTLVAELQTVYTGYFGAITDEATKTAIREGQTKAVNLAVAAIKHQISQQEGAVRAKYDVDAPTYQEFLPQGVTEYTKASLLNIEEKTKRFIKAATDHAADLPDLATLISGLLTAFTSARAAQLQSKGLVATGKTISGQKRDVVEIQLMKDILTIALDHIGDPDAGLAFFDQSIIRRDNDEAAPPANQTAPEPVSRLTGNE